MQTTNPFADLALPNPAFSLDEAAAVARERFGLDGAPRPLGSQQDQNVLIEATDRRAVLKIANPGFGRGSLLLQNAAMRHVAAQALPIETPVPLPALDGQDLVVVQHGGMAFDVRLVTFVEGAPLTDHAYHAPQVLEAVGRHAGTLAGGLADFDHPDADRVLQWDVRRAADVVAALAPVVADPARRALAERSIEAAWGTLERLRPALREQVIHGDDTLWNVVARRGPDRRPVPCGVIDFGDVIRSWLAAEAAVLMASTMEHAGGRPLACTTACVRGFHAALPLRPEEVDALHAMVLARLAACAVSSEQQVALSPDNAYAVTNREIEWAMLTAYAAVPEALATACYRLACDLEPEPPHAASVRASWAGAGPLLGEVDGRRPVAVDLSPTGDELRYDQPFAPRGASRAIAAAAAQGLAVARHGEARLTAAVTPSADEPATIALGAALFAPAGTDVLAPLDGRVERVGADRVVLQTDAAAWLLLAGVRPEVAPGDAVARGQRLATLLEPPAEEVLPAHLHVQGLLALPDGDVPLHAQPSLAAAWLALCPDPSPLLGTDVGAPPVDDQAALEARVASVASPQMLYYERPPQIVRGWRQWLFGADARPYLDVVNNVAVVGHSHPAIVDAAARQLRILNTNSRFLHPSMTRYASRLAALLPDPLEVVFLVSSGSEANDLALRIAREATGRPDVLVLRGAYHGWTVATHGISTAPFDNPHAAERLPAWVHPVEQPNSYNGAHRGPDAGARYLADLEARISALRAGGGGPSAFICEPLLGNSGGVELPDGYLAAAYDAVRAAGGLCIADEVQVGLGRLGERLWAFEREGVVPDLVTLAKPAGNGQPLGAVVTTRALADAFGRDASWFSSMGGAPVSCEIGLAVLDVLEREGLQENARVVGAHLRGRLRELVERHPLAGAAHGVGLYLGLELVRDRQTLEPASEEAYAVCERLRERGAIVQPTGDAMNVLKIKPPLCITRPDADFLADRIDEVLRDGW